MRIFIKNLCIFAHYKADLSMIINTQGIVISAIKFQEYSLIVKCYTKELGIQTYMLKGVLNSKKTALRKAYFQPLSLLDLVVNHRENANFQFIKDVKIIYHYNTIQTDAIKSSIYFFLSEIANIILGNYVKDADLFDFWLRNLVLFDHTESVTNFHIKFLLEQTYYLGFYPNDKTQTSTFFDLEEGLFHPTNPNNIFLNADQTNLLKMFMQTDFEQINTIKITRLERNELLKILLRYYFLHFNNFKQPKSIEVLQTIL